jgi:hypothetical protein
LHLGETYNLFVWSGAELFVIIVCGSVPPIKPLYDRAFGKKRRAGYTQQYSNEQYGMEGSMKRPLASSREMKHSSFSDDEPSSMTPARGITKVTDVRITHTRV